MKPILFNTEMVRAILDGRKMVTRRVVKPQPGDVYSGGNVELRRHTDGPHKGEWHCYRESPPLDKWTNRPWGGQIKPPYQVGDVLYVRESWANLNAAGYPAYYYKASDEMPEWSLDKRWHPSIHMPKEAARLFLRVTDVRAKRLQDMTNEDAEREGARTDERLEIEEEAGSVGLSTSSLREYFGRHIWDSTIKKKDLTLYGWDANPWVWVIEFERVERDRACI